MVFSCTVIVSAEDTVIEITKQPTTVNPSVEVSDAKGVIYQWQTLGDFAEGEITLENAAAQNVSAYLDLAGEVPDYIELEIIAETSSYNEETGWSPAVLGITQTVQPLMSEQSTTMYACLYFSAYFADNSIAAFEIPEGFAPTMVALADMDGKLSVEFRPNDEGTVAVAEIEEGGFYTLIVITEAAEILDLTVYGTVAGFEDVEGETESALSNVEPGNSYRCVITAKDGSTLYSDIFSAVYEIIKQPSAADPTFEVTFEEDASFQWYDAVPAIAFIDDFMTDINYGSYDAETGEWTPDADEPYEYGGYQEYEFYLFDVYLEEGQTVKVTISNPDAISPEDPDLRFSGYDDTYHAVWDENGVTTFTAPVSDVYYIYQYAIYPETATFKFETTYYDFEEIEGETEKTLQSPELGKFYAVSATYEDETVLRSDVFEMEYAITKQPTSEDLSVEVNFADDVDAYQWYNVVIGDKEVTEENADPSYYPGDSEGDPSYYDEENGYWVGSLYDTYTDEEGVTYYEYDIFNIELQEGDILTLTPSADVIDNIIYTSCDSIDSEEEFLEITNSWVYEDGTYTFVAPYADTFYLYVDTYTEDITFTAALKNVTILGAAIEGADEAALKAPEADTSYACIITYKNGIELVSDIVTVTEADLAILGDVNNDGTIDQYDYILVKRHYFETRLLTDDEMTRADVNKDGEVDQFDYILIARHYFGTYVIK